MRRPGQYSRARRICRLRPSGSNSRRYIGVAHSRVQRERSGCEYALSWPGGRGPRWPLACHASRAPALDAKRSQRLRDLHANFAATPLALRIARETAAWGRSVPMTLFRASPSARNVGLGILSLLRSPNFEQRVLKQYAVAQAPGDTDTIAEQPWFLSDGAPGPFLNYPAAVGEAEARAVARWHAEYSSPDALIAFSRPRSEHGLEIPVEPQA